MTRLTRQHRLIPRISGQAYLWLAVVIFGASGAITRKVTEIGEQHLINGRNPISLCNVLFVGNLCALIVMIAIYWRNLNFANLKQISRKHWIYLIAGAILGGAIAPSFFFQALALTSVNNVILIGRLEPPLTLALSVWLLRERVNFWQVVGAIVAFSGIILTVLLQPPKEHMMMNMGGGFGIGVGETLVALAAVAASVATILNKKRLFHIPANIAEQIPLGVYNIFRTALGTAIFFFIALILYGKHHFMDAFSPFLWQWMFVYGFVIVVMGQLFWVQGIKTTTISVASSVSSFTPIMGILAAYLILGEAPTLAQFVGGSVILVGIFLSQIGIWRKNTRVTMSHMRSTQAKEEVEVSVGFKGV
ncbi:MAG: DMT family transporter [Rhizonema sp. PD37]|nr:DMT family transporter [Rhizonema sp. PD37]